MPLSPLPLRRSDPVVRRMLGATFPDYRGRKISAVVVGDDRLSFDLHWSGGSRDVVLLIDPAGDRIGKATSPWFAPGDGAVVVPPGMILAVRSWFVGSDAGVTFYIRPASAGLGAGLPALRSGGVL